MRQWPFCAASIQPKRHRAHYPRGMILKRLLRTFGKLQRPLAWIAFAYGLVTLIGTIAQVIAAGEPRFTAVGVAVLIFLEGYSAARDVENELDTEGAAEQ
jgi:hypothetical protein